LHERIENKLFLYRTRKDSCQQNISLYDAWVIARTIALKIRPELEDLEAGRRVMAIIA
jgi:hypothetical protein